MNELYVLNNGALGIIIKLMCKQNPLKMKRSLSIFQRQFVFAVQVLSSQDSVQMVKNMNPAVEIIVLKVDLGKM